MIRKLPVLVLALTVIGCAEFQSFPDCAQWSAPNTSGQICTSPWVKAQTAAEHAAILNGRWDQMSYIQAYFAEKRHCKKYYVPGDDTPIYYDCDPEWVRK